MIQRYPSKKETRSFARWTLPRDPESVLIIRFHAIGDVAITLPASSALRSLFPNSEIDILTSEITAPMVRSMKAFDTVHAIPHSSTRAERFRRGILTGLDLRKKRYDVVVDLQRNWQSRFIRRMARPVAWGEFDRFGPSTAGERVLDTFHRTGFAQLKPAIGLELKNESLSHANSILAKRGWDPGTPLVILNPAGFWQTRNWPVENFVALARSCLRNDNVSFLLLGTERISAKAEYLERALGSSVINLVNKTSLGEALAVMQRATLVVSEDSGLMHMAWASGIPTIALLGSSRHQWSMPTGSHTRTFHSGDLPCAACMQPTCRFGDVHCLTRVTPGMVFEATQELLQNTLATTVRHTAFQSPGLT